MKPFLFVALVAAGCTSPQEVCKSFVQVTQEKIQECADAGGFGGYLDLPPGSAEAQCATVDRGCAQSDGGAGTIDLAQAAKCTTTLKTTSCAASQAGPVADCQALCK
jgi:hypothetical protein